MQRLWLQIEKISKATAAQKRLRRSLSSLDMPATDYCSDLFNRIGFSSENVLNNNILLGLPKTTDHEQLKI